MTAAEVRAERERREAHVAHVAAKLDPVDCYASGGDVVEHGTGRALHTAATHWDACLVMLALKARMRG